MREVSQTGDDSIMAGPSAVRRSLSVHFPWGGKAQGGSIRTYYILACSVLYLERTWICTVDGHCHGSHKIKMCARRQAHCCTRARTQCAHTRWYIRTQKLNCHRFQTLPISDLINLTSLIGSIYVEHFWKRWRFYFCSPCGAFNRPIIKFVITTIFSYVPAVKTNWLGLYM